MHNLALLTHLCTLMYTLCRQRSGNTCRNLSALSNRPQRAAWVNDLFSTSRNLSHLTARPVKPPPPPPAVAPSVGDTRPPPSPSPTPRLSRQPRGLPAVSRPRIRPAVLGGQGRPADTGRQPDRSDLRLWSPQSAPPSATDIRRRRDASPGPWGGRARFMLRQTLFVGRRRQV